MSESQVFEIIGRKQAQLEEVLLNYQRLLAIVKGVKDGSISLERLTITDSGVWTLHPEKDAA